MNILVTGAGGFIGRYLVARLRREGHNVMEHLRTDGDLLNRHTLDRYDIVDAVYHLAARTFVPESWKIPCEYINDNNTILTNVLEMCRKQNAKMIFISTYLYGEPEYLPIDEKHRSISGTPYHLSKKIGEDICEFYSRNFGIDVAVFRPFNVYGKGQNKEFLLPKVYCQVADRSVNKIEVFNLAPKRDYVYVEDFIEALARILPYVNGFDVYNMGSGMSYSVKEAIDIIQKELATDKPVCEKYSLRMNEVMDCVADTSHLESVIGKVLITPMEEGIHKWHIMERG